MTFWRMLLTKQLLVAFDFHSMRKKNIMKVNSYQKLFVFFFLKLKNKFYL